MKTFDIDEVQTRLSALVEHAANGHPFIITQAGKPMATVVPLDSVIDGKRRLGFLRDHFSTPDDFDRMGDDEILRLFGCEPE